MTENFELSHSMIKCLPQEVKGKLRSGVALPSLQQCVEELILNSIDAEATCVGVRMDMEAFKVQVIDNGAGMNAEDLECVGNRYYTSKCRSVEDLDNLKWYGFRGEALASAVSLATLVEISSRTRSSVKTHVKIFKDGKGRDVFEAETARPSAGTTVVICNFFYNMPVRRKRMDPVLEAERIRRRVEAVALMHPVVSFTLKNDCTGAMLVQLSKARDTYHRFVQIHGLSRAQNLREIRHTHEQFEVTGYISREGHYNNSLQFLYVNDRLLLKTRIHKLLNFLLRRLSSSSQRNDGPEGQSAIRSPKLKRSQELHGLYVINIKCPYSEYDICLEPAKTLIEFKEWGSILFCVEEAVKAFLKRENLTSEDPPNDLDCGSSGLFGAPTAELERHNSGSSEQAVSSAFTVDCSIGLKMASHFVHRKSKDDPQSSLMECSVETEQQGDEEMNTDQLDNKRSEQNCRDEPPCDSVRLEPALDNDDIQEKTMLCLSGSERENKEIKLSNASSASSMTSQESVTQHTQQYKGNEQISPEHQQTQEHRHSVVSKKKISLSDPYIHECLQTAGPAHFTRPVHQQQGLTQKCEDGATALKRKISLGAGHDRACQTLPQDFVSSTPSKIHRLSAGPKVSLSKESGSLEKFRRIYGKSNELKLQSKETREEDKIKLPRTDRCFMNPMKLLAIDKHRQESDATKREETQRSPPTLLNPNSKPVLAPSGGKNSLAAKLCLLKQHRMNPSEVLQHSIATGSQDSNNNKNSCAVNSEPDPACGTDLQLTELEEGMMSGDWIPHYDSSLGKSVYINRVTGLSRYGDPPTEETPVPCTSDVTNMAVDVISEMGVEYRCYPFQGQLVLPFLPKSRTERVISSGLDDQDDISDGSNSLTSLYSKWKNPVFVRPPTVGVDVSSKQAEGLAVKIHNILFPYRFSKDMIHSMKVIQQVDKKFLACLISTRDEEPATLPETEGNLLVLVDQHAAHERVRLENLIADSYEDEPDALGEKRLCSSTIRPPLEISVTVEELRLFHKCILKLTVLEALCDVTKGTRSCQPHLRSLGLEVTFLPAAEQHVFVGKVPVCFMEKETNEIRRGRPSVIKATVEEYLREQVELLRSTGRVRGTLPLTVLKVLASLACHGAIKFNDSLTRDECVSLVASLSSCQLPFQCAHGRPSITPLVDVLHLEKDQKELQKPNLRKLRRMYKSWELYGNK